MRKNSSIISDIKAPDLAAKLGILYKVGMMSFLHHTMHRNQLQENILVGVNHAEKQEADSGMQLPFDTEDLINDYIVREQLR